MLVKCAGSVVCWCGVQTCQILLSWSGTPLTPGNSGRPDSISTNMHPAPLWREGRGGEVEEGSGGGEWCTHCRVEWCTHCRVEWCTHCRVEWCTHCRPPLTDHMSREVE